jgi:hypothetical protein
MSKSRFIRTTKWKLPRHRRSTRVEGAEEDRGRYIKCWNCGFLIDQNRGLSTGDGSGIQVSDFPTPTDRFDPDRSELLLCYWDSPFVIGEILHLGPDGLPDMTDVYTPRSAEAVGGCPFCGTKNLP